MEQKEHIVIPGTDHDLVRCTVYPSCMVQIGNYCPAKPPFALGISHPEQLRLILTEHILGKLSPHLVGKTFQINSMGGKIVENLLFLCGLCL